MADLNPLQPPYQNKVTDPDGYMDKGWLSYFTNWAGKIIAGAVNQVNGTAGRILVTGTQTNPIINIDPAYVAGASQGGTGLGAYTLGDTLYASGPSTLARLPGAVDGFPRILTQTGTGSSSAAPAWMTRSELLHVFNVLDYPSWSAADAAAASAGAAVSFPPGNYTLVGADFSFSASVEMMPGAVIDGSHTLTFNGNLYAGWERIFGPSITVIFGEGSIDYVRPHWKGAKGTGLATDDDSDACIWALSYASTQYRSQSVNFGSFKYFITKRLVFHKACLGVGTIFILGGSGDQFKLVNNPAPTANACVDCAMLFMDGGEIIGATIVAASGLDVVGNEGIWLVCIQECYGKGPVNNARVDGITGGKHLNGVTVRFCTTSSISNIGGSYFKNGFRAYSCNNADFSTLFFEQIANATGNKPFEFNSCGECTIRDLWTEGGGNLINGFTFESCGNMGHIFALKLGEAASGDDWLNGVYLHSCTDFELRDLSTTGLTFARTVTFREGCTRIGCDDTYSAQDDTYGSNYLIENGNFIRGKIPHPYGLTLANTFGKIDIGNLVYGTVLQITMTSKSGAITAPAIDIYRLSGGVYNNRGTLTFANFASAGDAKTLTFNIDAGAFYCLSPSAGSGRVAIEWKANLVNGLAFA